MHPTSKNISSGMSSESAFTSRAVVIGLYGVPGTGKTFLLGQLKHELRMEPFAFYDGSKMIATVVPGGLDAFKKMEEQEKEHWRKLAIDTIGQESAEKGNVAIVAGHYMFWSEGEVDGNVVCTQNDLDIFTHILYLDVPAEIILQRRRDDKERIRPADPLAHIRKWQEVEKSQLRRRCRDQGILFSIVPPRPTLLDKVLPLIRDFRYDTEKFNQALTEIKMDEVLAAGPGELETILVLDADRTLAAEDTGTLFWKRVHSSRLPGDEDCPLKTLFSSSLGYSYKAFRQATLLYEESADDAAFDALCEDVASAVTMYPEFVSLLRSVTEHDHIGAVVVTCGLRRVWEKVLEREGLSKTVKVIGGGRISEGVVVTAPLKAALVTRLQEAHRVYVWAFGDSVLDLEMLGKADQAIVVVGAELTRSKTMDRALEKAIDHNGLRARQVVLPSNAPPRLDNIKLPLVQFTAPEFITSVVRRRSRHAGSHVCHATNKKAAKLLMTQMRNANIAGPSLREAHHRVGWYLATEFVADVIGTEKYDIPHVQGGHTDGYRLAQEKKTTIVALMRGGEPMALGVNEAFPLAMFIHAREPGDIKHHHLETQHTVMLVDSVVNNGKTVMEFVKHIHSLHTTIRIVVVVGVVQAKFVSEGGLAQAVAHHANLSVIALRLSENKYTGTKTTDTGNRLFNTIHLA